MDGGYYYGSHLKIRTFVLDCFFEDLTETQLRKLSRWLDRKTAGPLVFDARPHVKYMVRPSKPFEPELYEHVLEGNGYPTYSGTFSMTFTAPDPFGYLTDISHASEEDVAAMRSYCGVLREDQMPKEPDGSTETFLVYNCGTEPCGLNIALCGRAPNG